MAAKAVDRSVVHIERNDTAATAFVVHDQVDCEIFDVEFGRVAQRLPIHRMQHGVAGAIGGGARPLRSTLAVMGGHAAKGTLVDFSIFLATRERQAPVLQLVNGGRRIAAKIFDRILVSEPVGALDCVVHVPAPVILAHIAKCGGDASLRGDGMRAGWKNFCDASRAQARFAASHDGACRATAIRSKGMPRAASARIRRAISTHSCISPGAETTSTVSSSLRSGGVSSLNRKS